MKKFSFIALTALACMGIVSCDEYTLPNPPGQSNEPEAVFQTDGLQLTNLVDGTIDIPALTAAEKPVDLFSYILVDFPASYELQLVSEFSADDTFAKTETATLTLDEGTASLRAGELQQIFNSLVSKDLVAKPLYTRVAAYAVAGTSTARIGGPDVYFYEGQYTVLPNPQPNLIEEDYYIVGNFCNWDIKKAVKMNHLNEGNVYDNPDFYLKVDVTEADVKAGGYSWKLIPESSYKANSWEGAYGVADLSSTVSSTTGNLLEAPEAETRAYTIDTESSYMIKVNMETRKFEVMLAFENLWIPATGYSTTNFNQMLRLATTDYIHYSGTLYLQTNFWFTGQPNLRGIVYRPDGALTTDEATKNFDGKMQIDNSGSSMMRVANRGLYYVTADIAALTYKGVFIKSIQIIGQYNEWNAETARELTATNAKCNVWTIDNLEMPVGEYKFCVDHAWTYSYGGAENDIVQNGGNLKIEEAGKYSFELHFDTYPAHLVVTKK